VWLFAWNAQGMGTPTTVDAYPGTDLPLVAGPVVPWAAAWHTVEATAVSWGAAVEGNAPVAGYDVILLVDGAFRSWSQTGPDGRSVTLPAIPEGAEGQVYVFAHSATQLGPLGEPIPVIWPH
jgi:hypothetical protein